ncbi:hypothetical protein HA466_0101030 [Hirschfeldia incana]|nr:hypothetical protein HA466_0101030 [Hirschfeldia incana]
MDGDHSASGSKRRFEDDEIDTSVSKKCCTCTEEGAAAVMIVSLTESLLSCKDELASCQSELESAKAEIDKWNSAFKKESFVPARKSPEPEFVIDYIQTLKSSEKSLKEELEIAQMKLAIRDLRSQLKPASMKTYEDPEVDGDQQGSARAGPSQGETPKDDEQEEPEIASLKRIIEDQGRVIQTQKSHIETQYSHIQTYDSHIQKFKVVSDYLASKDPQFAILLRDQRATTLDADNDQSRTVNDLAGNNDSNAV